MDSQLRALAAFFVVVLFVLFAEPASAQRDHGRYGDWIDMEADRDEGDTEVSVLANLICLGGFALVAFVVYAVTHSKSGSSYGSGIPFESEEEVIRRGLAKYEADMDEEEREAEAVRTRPPRTLAQIVEETVAIAPRLGVFVSEEQLVSRYGTVGASDFGEARRKKIKAIVTSTPQTWGVQHELFEPQFEGHLGSATFRLNVIDESKVDALYSALDTYGDERGLDLGIVSCFTMRVDRHLTVANPDMPVLPDRGDEIDVVVERSGRMDERGREILFVVGYTAPKREPRRTVRRPPRDVVLPDTPHRVSAQGVDRNEPTPGRSD